MRKAALLLLLPALYLPGCKTSGSRAKGVGFSDAEAIAYVAKTVKEQYKDDSDVVNNDAVINEFAERIVKGSFSDEPDSAQQLQTFYDEATGGDNDALGEFKDYIQGKFAGLTNYTGFKKDRKRYPTLQVTGQKADPSITNDDTK